MRHYRLIVMLLVVLASCKSSKISDQGSSGLYHEDLSHLRPDLMVEKPKNQEEEKTEITNEKLSDYNLKIKLDTVNKHIVANNEAIKYIEGYTIQIYQGNDRNAADEAAAQASAFDETLEAKTTYYQPNYKVNVGAYTNKLEAYKAHQHLLEVFPNALLNPDRIAINHE